MSPVDFVNNPAPRGAGQFSEYKSPRRSSSIGRIASKLIDLKLKPCLKSK
jgi:hypothetical protein